MAWLYVLVDARRYTFAEDARQPHVDVLAQLQQAFKQVEGEGLALADVSAFEHAMFRQKPLDVCP